MAAFPHTFYQRKFILGFNVDIKAAHASFYIEHYVFHIGNYFHLRIPFRQGDFLTLFELSYDYSY